MDTVTLTIGRETDTRRQYVDIPAKVFGVWAVHRPYCGLDADGKPILDDTGWAISHAPTGFRLPCEFRLRSGAWGKARELADTFPAFQSQEEITKDVSKKIWAILYRHGAKQD